MPIPPRTHEDAELHARILRALVGRLVANGTLTPADVRALLLDAVKGLDIEVCAGTPRAYTAAVSDVAGNG